MDADGGSVRQLPAPEFSGGPQFAPDGRTLMYVHSGEVCFTTLDLTQSCAQWLRFNDGTFVQGRAWAPDAARIAFSAMKSVDPSGYAGPDIYVINVDGTGRHELVGGHHAFGPAWSPDGTRVAFAGTATTDWSLPTDLYTVAADGSGLLNLTNTAGVSEQSPDWAPDGSRLVYQTDNGELRTIAANGTDDRLLGAGSAPVYSPDGMQVAAIAGGHVVRIPAGGGAPTPVTSDARFDDDGVTWGRVPDPPATPTPTPTPTGTPSPTTVHRRGAWIRPRRPDGFTPTKVRRRTRRVRIELRVPRCGTFDHAVVRRRRHAIVITAIYRVVVGNGYAVPSCPRARNRARMVSLRGRLGRRAVTDGSRKPPRVRYRAPRR
jgi:dipeptidyl aminopeptidase/acylaminoacyl peptidase